MIKVLIGGSPCTFWSRSRNIANDEVIEKSAKGIGWELFENYGIAKNKFKPDLFLYENNKSISKQIKDAISAKLGVKHITLNSSIVSAQHREREYWCNWEVTAPLDIGVELKDIIEGSFYGLYCDFNNSTVYRKSRCLGASSGTYRSSTFQQVITQDVSIKKIQRTGGQHEQIYEITDAYGDVYIDSITDYVRNLTPVECERLQTLPDGYTAGISNSRRYKSIGNGWTAAIITHILGCALDGVSRDEEIIVLSLYDGIGTGRYCFDQLGFKNITYFAYEIDKYAKYVASRNYPDIIQKGDAFQVRHPDWTIGY